MGNKKQHLEDLETQARMLAENSGQWRGIAGRLKQWCASETAQDYVRQLQADRTLKVFSISSNNSVIDVVLNQKHQAAREMDIEIEFHVTDLANISIDTTALVVLLSNLLDNAIEACQQLSGERIINCTILASEDLFLSIKNH